jgi:hypothetical protein
MWKNKVDMARPLLTEVVLQDVFTPMSIFYDNYGNKL